MAEEVKKVGLRMTQVGGIVTRTVLTLKINGRRLMIIGSDLMPMDIFSKTLGQG